LLYWRLLRLLLTGAHALQLLEQLLWSPHPWRGRRGCPGRWHFGLWWCRHLRRFLIIAHLVRIDLRRRRLNRTAASRGGSENKFSRRAVAQVPEQDQIVGSSVEQVGEYIARSARAEATKDALVAAQPFHLHAAPDRNLAQNGGQAGVVAGAAKE
jgi:hypothetical protein